MGYTIGVLIGIAICWVFLAFWSFNKTKDL